ncbi:unnamed protein product [Brachionus calyciflorus]|uniref:Uncharacterized protein n=1 Tax=Brachionus calyciflorus TaxID=104777 RepID=A0A814JBC6_9BILA|nr:unnamed protein product [Brachionus calyciflorus]
MEVEPQDENTDSKEYKKIIDLIYSYSTEYEFEEFEKMKNYILMQPKSLAHWSTEAKHKLFNIIFLASNYYDESLKNSVNEENLKFLCESKHFSN